VVRVGHPPITLLTIVHGQVFIYTLSKTRFLMLLMTPDFHVRNGNLLAIPQRMRYMHLK